MSDLIAIVYPTEAKAEEVRQRLFELQKEYLIKVGDAVIATKTEAGKVKLNQLVNTTAAGAASGSFWGLLIGVLFLNPLIGVAVGAASGAIGGALTDVGINDAFMKDLAGNLQPGNGALFVLVQEMTADKVLKEISSYGGVVLKTSLDETKEQVLRDALQKATTSNDRAGSGQLLAVPREDSEVDAQAGRACARTDGRLPAERRDRRVFEGQAWRGRVTVE
jgi:uncharacterized membrane protein